MPKLTDPIQLGTKVVKNRLWGAPMNMNMCDWWGIPSPQLIKLYEERAKGGLGLITVECALLEPHEGNALTGIKIYHPKHMVALNKIVEVVHRWGTTIVMQLGFAGRQSFPWTLDPLWTAEQLIPLAPSIDTPLPPGFGPAKQITEKDIERIYERAVIAATLIQKAHFDGIQLHFSHGFLPQQFMSPWTNHRTDKYGLQEGRILFCTDLIKKVKQAVGPNFIVGVRLAATDGLDDVSKMIQPAADPQTQLTVELAQNYAKQIEEAGADYIEVTGGVLEAVHKFLPTLYYPRGYFLNWAESIKKNVKVPVSSGGKVYDKRLAEKAVESGRVDAVFIGRLQFSDPEAPRKIFANKEDDIRKCISCSYCMQRFIGGLEVGCAINPDLSSFALLPVRPSKMPRKVMIIGGGVAGMESARLCALFGHDVILYEEEKELGGMVKNVSNVPRLYMRDLSNIVEWQERQLRKLNIKVELGEEVSMPTVEKVRPDVVILATGAYFDRATLPGGQEPICFELRDYLAGRAKVGDKIIVTGVRGAEVALSIAREGKQVTLLEEGPAEALQGVPWMVPLSMRGLVLLDFILKEPKLSFLTEVKIEQITMKKVIFIDKAQKREHLEADTVIVASNHIPSNKLEIALRDKVKELYATGDCVFPGTIKDAIYSAHVLVREKMELI